MQAWELAARERIRDTLARYNWSGDAGRLDDMAGSFREDGELQLRGEEPLRGRAAIAEFLSGITTSESGVARIVRHNLTNIHFLEVTPERARVASYFTVLTEIGLDHYGRYRDSFVPVGNDWLIRHRFVSTDWVAPNSTMASRP
ncbi:MAG: nuclear transport factor 2 family protein [Candidatus Sericytochromatia bacterium]